MVRSDLSASRRHECSGDDGMDIKTVTIKGIVDMVGEDYPLYTYGSPENIINDIIMLWENGYSAGTSVVCNFKLVTEVSGARTESHVACRYGGVNQTMQSATITDGRIMNDDFML